MKTIKKIIGSLAAVLMLGSFVACNNNTTDNSGTEEEKYYISFNEDTTNLKVDVDSSITLTVKESKGTWKVKASDSVSVQEGKNESDVTTYTITGKAENAGATITFYPEEAGEDESFDTTLTVKVYGLYELKLKLDEAIAEKAATISVYYEGKEDNEETASLTDTVQAVYTATETTATANLKKSKANAYDYFNNIVVTVKDADENEIEIEQSVSYICHSATEGDGYLTDNTMTISESKSSKTFTISFDGFTIPGGSVTGLRYSTAWAASSDEWTEENIVTPEVTVADDGASASFAINNTKEFYINWTEVKILDSEECEISLSSGFEEKNQWYSYADDDTHSITAVVVSGSYVDLITDKTFSAASEYTQVLDSANFANLSISTLKVVVKLTSAKEYWACASAAAAWATGTYASLAWSDSDGGYSGIIKTESFISALQTAGLYLNTASDAQGTVSVSYIAK